jgi:Bacterial Type VI secretion, VC_A0110, EvfL, ImpJ, VasE
MYRCWSKSAPRGLSWNWSNAHCLCLGLTRVPAPPAEVAAKMESQYFVLYRTGPCWQHIVETRQAGVHVPGEIPSSEMSAPNSVAEPLTCSCRNWHTDSRVPGNPSL